MRGQGFDQKSQFDRIALQYWRDLGALERYGTERDRFVPDREGMGKTGGEIDHDTIGQALQIRAIERRKQAVCYVFCQHAVSFPCGARAL